MTDPTPLDEVRRFRFVRTLGEGGMGVVYEAVDRELDRRVAVKTLRATDAECLLRLKREFRVLRDISHPNLVQYHELIEDGGRWYLSMELVDRAAPIRRFVARHRESADTASSHDSAPTLRARDNVSPVLYDEPRLRGAFGQLAGALSALHHAGKVHRDVKPSNVLVDQTGRVVLLDFGLVTDAENRLRWTGNNVVGTAAYMAPEQAAAKTVGPGADWYAFGTVLYEALTGRLPFLGSGLTVLLEKQRSDPPAPAVLEPRIGGELSDLCIRLLRFDPSERPDGRQVLDAFGVAPARAMRTSAVSASIGAHHFVGRDREVRDLRRWFDGAGASPVAVFVLGESGMGKTELATHFVAQMARDAGAVVLPGRCYENESVPYRAVDSVVDALARYLRALDDRDRAALVPRRAALLLEVFPVLRSVDVLAEAPHFAVPDPQENRQLVFRALGELLGRVADRVPLVIVVDDFQWADPDSLALLRHVLQPPDAPAVMLLFPSRNAAGEPQRLPELPCRVERLDVEPFAVAAATELAESLLARAAPTMDSTQRRSTAGAIAHETAGHPLFIDELVRHAVDSQTERNHIVPLSLDEALATRIARLGPHPVQVLQTVCLSSMPLPRATLCRATGLQAAPLERAVSVLRVSRMVRTGRAHDSDTIEPYHARIRVAALANIDADARRELHGELARALKACHAGEAEALSVHLAASGDAVDAARYARIAADQAVASLAFDRAAQLYRRALELGTPSRQVERETLLRLGRALANAGRSREAADTYALVVPDAKAAEALELNRQSAELLLRSGHIEDGLALLRTVLADVRMRYPRTPRRALLSAIALRARVRLRGGRFRERDTTQIRQDALTRLDTCWSAATGLSLIDVVRGAYFQGRHLLLALDTGEPYRIARALAVEAAHAATAGPNARRRFDRLIATASDLAERTGNPHAIGMVALAQCAGQHMMGNSVASLEWGATAEDIFLNRCTGVSWELNTARYFCMYSSYYYGDLERLSRTLPRYFEHAVSTGDQWALSHTAIASVMVAMTANDATAADRYLRTGRGTWAGASAFHAQHMNLLQADVVLDLFRGDPVSADARIERAWPMLRSSLLLRVHTVRLLMSELRARVALALAAYAHDRRAQALTRAARIVRSFERLTLPWAKPHAELILAGVATLGGDDTTAVARLRTAIELADASDLRLVAQAARWRLGTLLGGSDGRVLVDGARDWLEAQGARDPARLVDVVAPGFAT